MRSWYLAALILGWATTTAVRAGTQKCIESSGLTQPKRDSSEVSLAHIVSLLDQAKYADAASAADEHATNYGTSAVLFAIKGAAFAGQEKGDDAEVCYNAALALDDKFYPALIGKAKILSVRGQNSEALALLDRAILALPNLGRAYTDRGVLKIRMGALEPALADIQVAIEKLPNRPDLQLQAVSLLTRLNRFDEALQQIDPLMIIMADDARVHWMRGQLLILINRSAEAKSELEASIAIQPSTQPYYLLLRYDLLVEPKQKLDAMLWIIGHEPHQPIPAGALKSLSQDQQAYSDLVSAYDSALIARPDLVYDTLRVSIKMEESFGHLDSGMVRYDKTIAANPGDAKYRNDACWERATRHFQLDKALAECDAAIAINPDANSYDSRGFVHLQRGEWKAAIADYDIALANSQDLAESLFGRGIAKLRLGKMAEGSADLTAARAANSKIDKEFAGYGLQP